jgi:hypothetical protein
MSPLLKRNKFNTSAAAVTAAPSLLSPRYARVERPARAVVGFLNGATAAQWVSCTDAFCAGLSEAGYVEGENLSIEYRWANGRHECLQALAAELIDRKVDVIAASGGVAAALAAQALTDTIPIVYTGGNADCIRAGLTERASFIEVYRQAGAYTGRLLKGAREAAEQCAKERAKESVKQSVKQSAGSCVNPAWVPVEQPARYRLHIDFRAAKALAFKARPILRACADEESE